VNLLRYVVKCTVTDSPFGTQASCSKCPPPAWITFLARVTRELVTLRSTAVLRKRKTKNSWLNCMQTDIDTCKITNWQES